MVWADTVYASLDDAMDQVFPNTQVVTRSVTLTHDQQATIEDQLNMALPTTNIQVFSFYDNDDALVGHGMVTNQIGKYEPITFFVGVDHAGHIRGVVVMVYRESHGRQVRKKWFLKQFIGKSREDSLTVGRDITPLSGATLSAYALANGVRRVLAIIQETQPHVL